MTEEEDENLKKCQEGLIKAEKTVKDQKLELVKSKEKKRELTEDIKKVIDAAEKIKGLHGEHVGELKNLHGQRVGKLRKKIDDSRREIESLKQQLQTHISLF